METYAYKNPVRVFIRLCKLTQLRPVHARPKQGMDDIGHGQTSIGGGFYIKALCAFLANKGIRLIQQRSHGSIHQPAPIG